MAEIDYQEPSFLGRLSFEWCGEGQLRPPQYENQKSCFFLCLEFRFSEQNGEIQPEKVTRKIAGKKSALSTTYIFWRRGGDLNPKFLGRLVLQGELPRSPLLPRAFKLPA